MEEVYEYRLGVRRHISWFAALGIAMLIGYATQGQTPMVLGAVWGLTAVMIIWFLSRLPVAGVRVDDRFVTLSAWRDPKMVPISDIAHFRMTHWTDDSDLILVYKNGAEEFVSAGDLPSVQLFSEVMADRGVAIKDPLPEGVVSKAPPPEPTPEPSPEPELLGLEAIPTSEPAQVEPQDRRRRRKHDHKTDPRGAVADADHAEPDPVDYVEEWVEVAERVKRRRQSLD